MLKLHIMKHHAGVKYDMMDGLMVDVWTGFTSRFICVIDLPQDFLGFSVSSVPAEFISRFLCYRFVTRFYF